MSRNIRRWISLGLVWVLLQQACSIAIDAAPGLSARAICALPTINPPGPIDPRYSTQPSGNNGTDDYTEPDLPLKVRRSGQGLPILAPGTVGDDALIEDVAAGKALWAMLQATLGDPSSKDAQICDIDARWDVIANLDRPKFLDREWDKVIPRNVISEKAESFFQAAMSSPKGWQWKFKYINEYSPVLKAIVVTDAVGAAADLGDPTKVLRAKDRWSDITWAYWNTVCKAKNADPSELSWVLQQSIINDKTEDLVYTIVAADPQLNDLGEDEPRIKTLLPTQDEFYALLKCPNVIGTVYMLIRYANALKRRTVASISIGLNTKRQNLFLWVGLEAFVPVHQSPSTQAQDDGTVGVG